VDIATGKTFQVEGNLTVANDITSNGGTIEKSAPHHILTGNVSLAATWPRKSWSMAVP